MKLLYKRHLLGIILGFICLAGLVFTFQPAAAQDDGLVRVRVLPEDTQVAMGEYLDVAVAVSNAKDLYAIDILLEFDPTMLEVVDMNEKLPGIQVQLGTMLEPGFVMINLADNSIGRLRLAMTQLNPATPKNGNGNLIVVRFQPLAVTSPKPIKILKGELATPYGYKLDVAEIKNGTIEVLQAIVGPTATDIPAQDPGTPMPSPTFAPTATGTQVAQPSATATLNLLALLSTSTVTIAPQATLTATQTPQPSATMMTTEPSATVETEVAVQVQNTPADKPGLPATVTATENESARSMVWLWVLIAVVVLAIAGGVVWMVRKKKPNKPMEY